MKTRQSNAGFRHAAVRPSRVTVRPLALAMASASLLSLLPGVDAEAQSLPTGMTVVRGQASIAQGTNALTVTNSANAILNWSSFSIGANRSVRFDQPNSSSQVLNRVIGNDPSNIFGSLTSNGKVWLLNPNGILFGQGARVDVAGLVASTLNMSDSDWLARRYHLTAAPGIGSADVVNLGELRTPLGGRVMLLSSGDVRNAGVIDAPGGQVALAAGQSVDLVDTATPNVALHVTAPSGEALNLGTISAAAGRIDIQAAMVNQQGILRAESLVQGDGGTIVLRASESAALGTGSITSVNGTSGGRIIVDAGTGETLVSGTVSATGSGGIGGSVRLLGHHVGVIGAAAVDASGWLGGGEVLVGGGARGLDASVPNAEATYMGPDTRISADALSSGDGGHIVLWSDAATRVYGTLLARGGVLGGDGGLIETSGGWLDAWPTLVSAAAKAGKPGQWLLDPNNLTIFNSVSDFNVSGNPNFTTTGDSANLSNQTIVNALNLGNNVTIQTANISSNQSGNINVLNATISPAPTAAVTLTMTAAGNITVTNSTISSTSTSPLSLTLNSGGSLTIGGNSHIDTKSGDVILGAASFVNISSSFITSRDLSISSGSFSGASITSSNISARDLNITANTIGFNNSNVSTVNLNLTSSSDVNFLTTDISASNPDSPLAMNVSAGGLIFFNTSSVTTHGGNVVLGGTARPSLANFTAPADGALGGGIAPCESICLERGAGVEFLNSVIDAGSAKISATGNSVGSSGSNSTAGIRISGDSELRARDISLRGWAASNQSNGTIRGVDIQGTVSATKSLTIDGQGYSTVAPVPGINSLSLAGVMLGGTSSVSGNVPGALMSISGVVDYPTPNATDISGSPLVVGAGVWLAGDVNVSGGATATVTGKDQSTAWSRGRDIVLEPGFDSDGFLVPYVIDLTTAGNSTFLGQGNNLLEASALLKAPSGAVLTVSSTNDLRMNGVISGTPSKLNIHAEKSAVLNTDYDLSYIDLLGNSSVDISAPSISTSSGDSSFALSTGGLLALRGDQITLNPGTTLTSSAGTGTTSTAITVAGFTAPNVAQFSNDSGITALSTPNGRWLVYATAPASVSGLDYDFRQYASAYDVNNMTVVIGDGNGLLLSLAPTATLSNATPLSKVYDHTGVVNAVTNNLQFSGLLAGDTPVPGVNYGGTNGLLAYSDATGQVGIGKPIVLTGSSAPPILDVNGKPVYGYAFQTTVTGDITRAPLTVVNSLAHDKVYDGTQSATITGGSLVGVISGDAVTLGQSGFFQSGSLPTKNVGSGLTVVATDTLVGADSANYLLTQPGGLTASIGPATLTYTAQPSQVLVGGLVPTLTGTVDGFVTGDTQANATFGTATFSARAPLFTLTGHYPVDGSGLTSTNYTFVQAPGNATALNVVPIPVTTVNETPTRLAQAVDEVIPKPLASAGRVVDAVAATQPDPVTGTVSFGSIPIGLMSPDDVDLVLASRSELKKAIFGDALKRLEADPQLADLPECQTEEDLDKGTCLVGDVLKGRRPAGGGEARVEQAATPPPAPAVATGAPQEKAVATAPVPERTQAAVAPTAAAAQLPLSGRAVKSAALPQIRRKVALVIGTDHYADRRIPQLDNAVRDARAIAAAFENGLGYETILLLDATKEQVVRTLNHLALDLRAQDSVVIYYAGHGELVDGTGLGYWQMSNADSTQPTTWLSNSDIRKFIGQIPALQVALISDSCFSGSLVTGERIGPSVNPLDPAKVLERKTAVAMSSGGNEPVSDAGKQGHSPFAWNLMKNLEDTRNWQGGSNVFERVRFAVAREVRQRPQYGALSEGSRQAGTDYLFEQRELTK